MAFSSPTMHGEELKYMQEAYETNWMSKIGANRNEVERITCEQVRGSLKATYAMRGSALRKPGTSCPTEILEAIAAINAEGRPIWKPMHLQPMYRGFGFVKASDGSRGLDESVAPATLDGSVGADIFERGLCLPSNNKMTMEQVDVICEVVRECFG